jgi:hypothetical protein
MAELYGKPKTAVAEEYEASDEYAEQGDERVIRDLRFAYTVATKDAAGNDVFGTEEAVRGDVVTVDQIGLAGLELGERHHSFYTDTELNRLKTSGAESAPLAGDEDITVLGAYELAEWLETNNPETGRPWAINAILEQVGNDKDLAQRMLEAENIRSDGDPREGLVQGLTAIIERSG